MICPIHDVAYPEGQTCWCCDQVKENTAHGLGTIIVENGKPIIEHDPPRIDAPLPPLQVTESDNLHCGKHDTIYTAETPCRGCQLESVEKGAIKGPDDTLQEFRENASQAQASADAQNQHIWPRWFRDWLKDFRP